MPDKPVASPGHTTILAAVGRAIHLEGEAPPLVADRFALDLAGDAGVELLAALRKQATPDGLANLGRAFAIRARLVEDEVERAAAAGVRQYLVLGAGLDSFALRRGDRADGVQFFEVDRPAAQAWKRARMAKLGIAEPAGTVFVPVDFETGGLTEGLQQAGFDFSAPAVVSWIPVIQYL
ncbi:MAG TPA: class I SAM-dependent methyltransferase, partial [Candidatus Dormibacteraeota bacterium]|nr:class I SAM-dependent methyltransferase [Candidatus Dormibacteraeota bacterium]